MSDKEDGWERLTNETRKWRVWQMIQVKYYQGIENCAREDDMLRYWDTAMIRWNWVRFRNTGFMWGLTHKLGGNFKGGQWKCNLPKRNVDLTEKIKKCIMMSSNEQIRRGNACIDVIATRESLWRKSNEMVTKTNKSDDRNLRHFGAYNGWTC